MNPFITPKKARHIAHSAFVYGYPMVENYLMMYKNFIKEGREFNKIYSPDALITAADTWVVTPSNDSLYSKAWLDLRAEPYVLTIPKIPSNRYYSFQLVDYFTNNVDYVGTRGGVVDGAKILLAGPNWKAVPVPEVQQVIQIPSQLFFLLGRTGIQGPDDLQNVLEIVKQYDLTPLSTVQNQNPPPPAESLQFPSITEERIPTLEFFTYLNMCLTYFQGPQDAKADGLLMEACAEIDVGPGKTFNPDAFSSEVRRALELGIESGYALINGAVNAPSSEEWRMVDPEMKVFGTTWRDYLVRAVIARGYLYMNDPAEALYPKAYTDEELQALTGEYCYTMRFDAGQLPPANAFWSVTMYDAKTLGLVDNDDDRYSLGTYSSLATAKDGSTTLYIQHEPPSNNKSDPTYVNWLPAPAGEFYLILRVYIPQQQMLDGKYEVPKVIVNHSPPLANPQK